MPTPDGTRYCLTNVGAALLALLAACAPSSPNGTPVPATPPAPVSAAVPAGDTASTALIPPGYGTLRQDDVAIRVTLVGGVSAQAIPLDESVLRVLSPDSYSALRNQLEAFRPRLGEIARRFALPQYTVWSVTYFGVEQGEARFSPFEFIVTSAGRDFRPLDIVPLTDRFGEQRLRQRDRQTALFVFDGALDVNQPMAITVETTRDDSWASVILPRVERERALVRSRSAREPRRP